MCIDLDLDSDIIIEEGEVDFKSRCLIVKGEKVEEDEGAQADELSKEGMEPSQKQGEESASQMTEQKMEDPDEMISNTLTQDFNREVVERKFLNLAQHYQHISDSFAKLVNEVPHMRK